MVFGVVKNLGSISPSILFGSLPPELFIHIACWILSPSAHLATKNLKFHKWEENGDKTEIIKLISLLMIFITIPLLTF